MDYVEKTRKSFVSIYVKIFKYNMIYIQICIRFLYVFISFLVLYIDSIKYMVQKYEHRLHNAERIYENNVCVHVPKAKIYTACLFYQECIQKSDLKSTDRILLPIQAVATSMDYVEETRKSFVSIYVKICKYNMIYSNLYTVFICVQIFFGIAF